MPTIYEDANVKCPYYRKYQPNRICCEGFKPKTGLNMTFEDSRKRQRYMDAYCNNLQNYKNCIICFALNIKYGGDKDGK